MSPFSVLIGELRKSRSMRQGDFAKAIGYEQSYVSGIESGTKSTPSDEFLQKMKHTLELNNDELTELDRVVKVSARKFNLPVQASPQMYELWHEFSHTTIRMQPNQIDLMRIVLRLINADIETNLSEPVLSGSFKKLKEVEMKKGQI